MSLCWLAITIENTSGKINEGAVICVFYATFIERLESKQQFRPMAHSYRLGLVTWGYRSGRIFVIVAVHIQCSKVFKGMECTVLPMVLCTIKNP